MQLIVGKVKICDVLESGGDASSEGGGQGWQITCAESGGDLSFDWRPTGVTTSCAISKGCLVRRKVRGKNNKMYPEES